LRQPGPFGAGSGTSYAAPRVARIAAVVRSDYPEASANLTRALIGLAARVPGPHIPRSDANAETKARELRLVGYGQPDERRAAETARNRVVLTYDGEIEVDTTEIHSIPIPREFAEGAADRSISIALAFDPPTRRFRREYLAGRMKFDLYRAFELDHLIEILKKQPSDEAAKKALPDDRRRANARLLPGQNAVMRSTLQVRRWRASHAKSLDVDDGDTYYLPVTHIAEPWASIAEGTYTKQRYALAIELEDRSRQSINILERVQERVERLRART